MENINIYKNVKLIMHGAKEKVVVIIKVIRVHRLGTVCVSVQKCHGNPSKCCKIFQSGHDQLTG